MSPRPAASRTDATAIRCLTAASRLIDEAVAPVAATHPRLRGLRFPASLDWIRISDVIRAAARDTETRVSRKALLNRWPTRQEFLRDAIVFAMCYRDVPPSEQVDPNALEAAAAATGLAHAVGAVADDVYAALMRHPRSFLLSQVAPFLSQFPAARQAVAESGDLTRRQWEDVYGRLLQVLHLQPRPDWPLDRISIALQCIIDGVVVRHQINADLVDNSDWQNASLLSDTVIAFCIGVLDFDDDGRSSRSRFEELASSRA